MTRQEKVERIERMKEELKDQYDRFRALREAGKNAEAVQQFNVTLKAAGELMEASSALLKDVVGSQTKTDSGLPEGKVLHLPKSDHIH